MAVRNAIDHAGVDNPSVICFANATSRDRFPSGSDQYTKGGFGGGGIMTWFCVSKIFGPVGPEKTVICDRSAFAERSCRGGHWPSEKLRFAEITGYVHAGRFRMTNGHPYGEDMALYSRGRCPHRPAPGRLRAGEWGVS